MSEEQAPEPARGGGARAQKRAKMSKSAQCRPRWPLHRSCSRQTRAGRRARACRGVRRRGARASGGTGEMWLKMCPRRPKVGLLRVAKGGAARARARRLAAQGCAGAPGRAQSAAAREQRQNLASCARRSGGAGWGGGAAARARKGAGDCASSAGAALARLRQGAQGGGRVALAELWKNRSRGARGAGRHGGSVGGGGGAQEKQ